ncbi:MAG: hypothetical protein QXG48_02195 [Thermofilaceae archaeon]
MKKKEVLAITLLLVLAPLALAQPYTVAVSFVGPDGIAIAEATVFVVAEDGTIVANGTTDARGGVAFSLPAGRYLLHLKSNYSILYPIQVTQSASVTVDASTMPFVKVASVPLLVDFNATVSDITVTLRTNTTVYRPGAITLSFPAEVKRWYVIPYKLYNITYDGVWTNETILALDARSYEVVAHYKLAFPVLEPWMMYALIGVVVLLIIFALAAGKKGAKQAIADSRRFVQRVGAERRFVKRRV